MDNYTKLLTELDQHYQDSIVVVDEFSRMVPCAEETVLLLEYDTITDELVIGAHVLDLPVSVDQQFPLLQYALRANSDYTETQGHSFSLHEEALFLHTRYNAAIMTIEDLLSAMGKITAIVDRAKEQLSTEYVSSTSELPTSMHTMIKI